MTIFALLSVTVTAGAIFSLLSARVLRLPNTIGTMLLSLAAAGGLILAGHLSGMQPGGLPLTGMQLSGIQLAAAHLVSRIDFREVVLHGMLAFLLFAGALQLDLSRLWQERVPVGALAIGATALSTVFVAGLLWLALPLVGMKLTLLDALLFGALISPTDPIAVMDMLRRAGAPPRLEVQLGGESLFNDGLGAVIFLALLESAGSGAYPTPKEFGGLLLLEAGGGILLGLALGWVTYRLLRLVDSYRVEVMLTLALAMGGYALADALHLSAPLEVVVAGLVVSRKGLRQEMSAVTRQHVESFWELIDDMMNVVLFLLLGLQLLVLPIAWGYLVAGLIAIPVVLLSRFASVGIVVQGLALFRRAGASNVTVLTWGGLRGGLAVALALALPASGARNLLLAVTFVVVVFSIVVQGLTLPGLLRRLRAQGRLG
jgi:CPA1 family monovalent cation:H+ antiporter